MAIYPDIPVLIVFKIEGKAFNKDSNCTFIWDEKDGELSFNFDGGKLKHSFNIDWHKPLIGADLIRIENFLTEYIKFAMEHEDNDVGYEGDLKYDLFERKLTEDEENELYNYHKRSQVITKMFTKNETKMLESSASRIDSRDLGTKCQILEFIFPTDFCPFDLHYILNIDLSLLKDKVEDDEICLPNGQDFKIVSIKEHSDYKFISLVDSDSYNLISLVNLDLKYEYYKFLTLEE